MSRPIEIAIADHLAYTKTHGYAADYNFIDALRAIDNRSDECVELRLIAKELAEALQNVTAWAGDVAGDCADVDQGTNEVLTIRAAYKAIARYESLNDR